MPPENPALFTDVEDLVEDVPALAANGWDVCVVDTPPSYMEVIETAIMVSDAVIIPIKCSIFDAGSLEPVVEMCKRRRKPYGLVLSDVDQTVQDANRGGESEPEARRPAAAWRRLASSILHRCAQSRENGAGNRQESRRGNRRAVARNDAPRWASAHVASKGARV